MTKISLVTYSLRFLSRNDESIYNTDTIPYKQGHFHLIDILRDYFNTRTDEFVDISAQKKLLTVNTCFSQEVQTFRITSGILETGNYGYASKIRDVATNEIIFEKTVNDAETLPFFYSFFVPSNGNTSICIFQRFSNKGFKTAFENDFNTFLGQESPEVRFSLFPLLPESYINSVLDNGRITKIRLVKDQLPSDLADAVIGHRNSEARSEFVISAKVRGNLANQRIIDKLKSLVGIHPRPLEEVFEIRGFEYNDIKVEVKIGSSTKTLSFGNLDNVFGSYDITDEVDIVDGHPEYSSILQISTDYGEHFVELYNQD